MSRMTTFQRKIVYLIAIALLLIPLFILGTPATRATQTQKGSVGGKLAQLRAEYDISQADLGEIDPTSEALKLSTLGMRGIATLLLWEKANTYKIKKDFTNMSAAVKQLARIQPNFVSVWIFQAWNFYSYNVSYEFDNFHDRYRWVMKGIDFLKEGMKYNKQQPRLAWEIGWYIHQKIGRSDERRQFRLLFKDDQLFHRGQPWIDRDWQQYDWVERRDDGRELTGWIGRYDVDNWLVANWWFEESERIHDLPRKKTRVKDKDPLIFRSDAPKCLINFAATLQDEGVTGIDEVRKAWKLAEVAWLAYGDDEISRSGVTITLNQGEQLVETLVGLITQIDAMQPGLREEILQEKRADLTAAQREAYDLPPVERDAKQEVLASKARTALGITHMEVANRIKNARDRSQAIKMARKAEEVQKELRYVNSCRGTVAFTEWKHRTEAEQEDDTLTARKFTYRGNQSFAAVDFEKAVEEYETAFQHWRKVFDRHPTLLHELNYYDDIVEAIHRYERACTETGNEVPAEDFILRDVVEEYGPER